MQHESFDEYRRRPQNNSWSSTPKNSYGNLLLLETQRHEVESLLAIIESPSFKDISGRKAFLASFAKRIIMHIKLEEEFLYARLNRLTADFQNDDGQEREVLRVLLNRPSMGSSEQKTLQGRIKFLRDIVERNIEAKNNSIGQWNQYQPDIGS